MEELIRSFSRLVLTLPPDAMCLFSLHGGTSPAAPPRILVQFPATMMGKVLAYLPTAPAGEPCYLYGDGEEGMRLHWPAIFYEGAVWSLTFTAPSEAEFGPFLSSRPCRRYRRDPANPDRFITES